MLRQKVARWIDKNYKRERLSRTPKTRDRIIADRVQDLEQYGNTLISHHDSVSGRTCWLHSCTKEAQDQ